MSRPASRRGLLKGLTALMAGGAVASLAAACAPQAPAPSPTSAPSKPAEANPAAAGQPTPAPKVEAKPGPADQASSAKPVSTVGGPKQGGTLKVAIVGEPPQLDPMFGSQTVTLDTMWHVFETPFARTPKQEPVPHLLESYEPSSDGKTAILRLRKDVLFHDGKEMTSADVAASLKRFGAMSPRGKTLFERVESVDGSDRYAVTMTFTQPTSGILPTFLSHRDAIVIPEELATAFPKDKLTKYVGTGPYRFMEHLPDRHIRLGRFDRYSALETPADGPTGKRVAYLDELLFMPVPEESVRVDGVGSGEYHYGESLAPDSYDRIKALPNVSADVIKPYYWAVAHFNKKESMFRDVRLRQAVLTAASIEPIARAAFGRPDFYRVGPELAAPETIWYTDVGQDVYNRPDPDKVGALLREAGYDGTPIRWLSTKENFYNYNGSLAFKQQLEAVGFKVDLQVMDWATVGKRRADPKEYDVHVTAHASYILPILQSYVGSNWAGWWESEEKDRVVGAIMAETDPQKQVALVHQFQALHYSEFPCIKFGEYFVLRARSNKVASMDSPVEPYFWNTWLT